MLSTSPQRFHPVHSLPGGRAPREVVLAGADRLRQLWPFQHWHPSYRARILSLLVMTGLPVLALALFGLARYVQESGADIAAERVAMAQSAALAVDAYAGDQRASARTLALDEAIADVGRREDLPTLLGVLLSANADWQQIAVFGADGRLLGMAGGGGASTDEQQQAYFQRALLTHQPVFGLEHLGLAPTSPAGTLVLAVPITFSDGEQGVIRIVPSLRRLASELQAQTHGPTRQIVLLDAQGTDLLPLASPDNPPPPVDESVVRAVLAGQTGSAVIGQNLLVAYAPVPNVGWGVVVTEPAATAFAPARRQAEIATLALVTTLLVAGVIGWLLGGRLAALYQRALAAQAAAEEAAQLRDSVLASVSHDLRSPLTAIRGQAELQLRTLRQTDPLDRERLERGASRIEQAAARMNGMIAELVDAARVQAGRTLELQRQALDLVGLVQGIVAEQAQTTSRHRLVFEPAEPRLLAVVDPVRLERVVANLLSNAITYSPKGGEVRVSLAREEAADGCWAVLTVQDQGLGIPAADLPHVFERFHRGRNVAEHYKGTGLGLAGARHIVEQHGGSIGIQSTEGVGTDVTVRLPVAPALH